MNATTTTTLPVHVVHEIEPGVWSVRNTVTHQWITDADGREDFTSWTDAHDLAAEYNG